MAKYKNIIDDVDKKKEDFKKKYAPYKTTSKSASKPTSKSSKKGKAKTSTPSSSSSSSSSIKNKKAKSKPKKVVKVEEKVEILEEGGEEEKEEGKEESSKHKDINLQVDDFLDDKEERKRLRERDKGKEKKTTSREIGAKRTPEQRVFDRAEVARLLRRGYSKSQIADKLGVHRSQVIYDWKIILEETQKEQSADAKARVYTMLQEYQEIRREAWEAWDKSKQDILREEEENTSNRHGHSYRSRTIKEGRNPNSEYLRTIMECLKAERELRGLDAPKEIDITARIDWDRLAGIIDTKAPHEIIEGEILNILDSGNPAGLLPVKDAQAIEQEIDSLQSSLEDAIHIDRQLEEITPEILLQGGEELDYQDSADANTPTSSTSSSSSSSGENLPINPDYNPDPDTNIPGN